MPNWCSNYIEIKGTKENMKPILDFFENGKQDKLVMSHFVPHDEEYAELEKSGNYLLNPQTEFYGTKWDFELSEVSICNASDDEVSFSVQTAWSPPEAFCAKLSVKYGVDVIITYSEPGFDFAGKSTFSADGEANINTYTYLEGLYEFDKEQFWSECEYTMESVLEGCDHKTTFKKIMKEEFPIVMGDKNDEAQLMEIYHRAKKDLGN